MKLLYPLIFILLSCSTEPEVVKDCAGVENGTATIDDCGICNGDNSTCIENSIIDIYELEDLNQNSSTYGQYLSNSDFSGKVILYYFPTSDTWSLCKSRFDSLNELYLEYGGFNSNIIIIGVGKNDGNSILTIARDTILPYIKETDDYMIRDELSVVGRDVYFYDTSGNYVNKVNLTAEFDKSLIESIIYDILEGVQTTLPETYNH